MIQEIYVSAKLATLLREKGFKEPCRQYYDYYDKLYFERFPYDYNSMSDTCISAPTLSMVMEWLRINHNLFIELRTGEINQKTWYDFDIIPINGRVVSWEILDDISIVECDLPEEAIEIAVRYCLENLL